MPRLAAIRPLRGAAIAVTVLLVLAGGALAVQGSPSAGTDRSTLELGASPSAGSSAIGEPSHDASESPAASDEAQPSRSPEASESAEPSEGHDAALPDASRSPHASETEATESPEAPDDQGGTSPEPSATPDEAGSGDHGEGD